MLTREFAIRAGVTTRQVARWVDAGAIEPAFRAPGRRGALAFDADDVDRFVARRRAELEEKAS